jgi:hypothetical protein
MAQVVESLQAVSSNFTTTYIKQTNKCENNICSEELRIEHFENQDRSTLKTIIIF